VAGQWLGHLIWARQYTLSLEQYLNEREKAFSVEFVKLEVKFWGFSWLKHELKLYKNKAKQKQAEPRNEEQKSSEGVFGVSGFSSAQKLMPLGNSGINAYKLYFCSIGWCFVVICFLVWVFFCGGVDNGFWTQGLVLARQGLNHLSHIPSLVWVFVFVLFLLDLI
jgi:hypothetical protein